LTPLRAVVDIQGGQTRVDEAAVAGAVVRQRRILGGVIHGGIMDAEHLFVGVVTTAEAVAVGSVHGFGGGGGEAGIGRLGFARERRVRLGFVPGGVG